MYEEQISNINQEYESTLDKFENMLKNKEKEIENLSSQNMRHMTLYSQKNDDAEKLTQCLDDLKISHEKLTLASHQLQLEIKRLVIIEKEKSEEVDTLKNINKIESEKLNLDKKKITQDLIQLEKEFDFSKLNHETELKKRGTFKVIVLLFNLLKNKVFFLQMMRFQI